MDPNIAALATFYNLKIMEKPYPYREAKLHEYSSLADPWHVVYYIWSEKKGELVRRRPTLSQPTAAARRKAARQIIRDINALLKAGAIIDPIDPESKPVTEKKDLEPSLLEITEKSKLTDAIDYFLKKKKKVLVKGTYSTYNTDLGRLKKYLTENDFEKIKLKDFQQKHAFHFMDTIKGEGDEDISNRSINNNKDTCSNLFRFFIDREIIAKNPFAKIKDLPSQAKRHTAFTPTQELTFINECIKQKEWQLLLFVLTVRYMALRPREEARLLRVRDIKETTIRVLSETAKGKISEHVQIPDEFQKILNTYKIRSYDENYFVFSVDGQPGNVELSRKYFYKKHFLILEKTKMLGLNLTSYAWKHTGVLALWNATQNIELIRKHCRHKDIATTIKYMRDLGAFTDYDQINKHPPIRGLEIGSLNLEN